jgi:hypothetical protein
MPKPSLAPSAIIPSKPSVIPVFPSIKPKIAVIYVIAVVTIKMTVAPIPNVPTLKPAFCSTTSINP